MANNFCAYIHSRPDGTPFYVGKGRIVRAYEFAPSRRTRHHKSITRKYGKENIKVCAFPCDTEEKAFNIEKYWIKKMISLGFVLINLTKGGEGASGRELTERQKVGLSLGRKKGRYLTMEPASKQNIFKGLEAGRKKLSEGYWKSTKRKHDLIKLSEIGAENFKVAWENKKTIICAECGDVFKSGHPRARCCSRLCEQRNRRRKDKAKTA